MSKVCKTHQKNPVTIYSPCIGCELENLHADFKAMEALSSRYRAALREIDTHIRSTQDPVPYIVETIKRVLPEYNEDKAF